MVEEDLLAHDDTNTNANRSNHTTNNIITYTTNHNDNTANTTNSQVTITSNTNTNNNSTDNMYIINNSNNSMRMTSSYYGKANDRRAPPQESQLQLRCHELKAAVTELQAPRAQVVIAIAVIIMITIIVRSLLITVVTT